MLSIMCVVMFFFFNFHLGYGYIRILLYFNSGGDMQLGHHNRENLQEAGKFVVAS